MRKKGASCWFFSRTSSTNSYFFLYTKSLFEKVRKCDIPEISFILKPRIIFPDVGVHVDNTDVPRFTTRKLDTTRPISTHIQ